VIGLQEVKHNQLVDIEKALPNYSYIGVGRDDGKKKGEYSPLFFDRTVWKLDSGESGTFWLSDTPEVPNSKSWGNGTTRICSWARLIGVHESVKGVSIYFYNTHWDHRSQPSRVKSAELILRRIQDRTHKSDAFVLMGDLNATTENPAVEHLLSSEDVNDPGKKQMLTWSGWNGELKEGLRIDHIFASSSISNAEAIVEINADERNQHAGSDHHPVRLLIPSIKK
jgi:endonuclease/exonuclease/phosphatase family metal-dependent hydrolase